MRVYNYATKAVPFLCVRKLFLLITYKTMIEVKIESIKMNNTLKISKENSPNSNKWKPRNETSESSFPIKLCDCSSAQKGFILTDYIICLRDAMKYFLFSFDSFFS